MEGAMENWFASLSAIDRFFAACAIVGSLGVLLRLFTQVLGFAGGELDVGDADAGEVSHHTGDGFKVISIHGLAAFFLMFGLVGFAAHRENNAPIPVALIVGSTAGIVSVWIISKLFVMAQKLQSVGNLDVSKVVGCMGTVYLKIPKGGSGRVMVNVRGRQREMDAVQLNGDEVDSGASIVVVKIEGATAVVDLAQMAQD
jgi:membrane protein implicated in regulation of membrane protease activity